MVGIAERLASIEQPIDLLVNNAGFAVRKKLTEADTTPHEHAIDVMIRAVLMLGAAAGRSNASARNRHHHQRLQYRGVFWRWAATPQSRPG